MKQNILPSIMAKSQKELNKDCKHLKGTVKLLHLDVVDGKFAKNQTFNFRFKLDKKYDYFLHLMVKNPEKWIEKKNVLERKSVKLITPHFEELRDIEKFITFMKNKKRKVSLAILPETKISSIKSIINELDYLLILTVHPGFYGSKFLKSDLNKIKQAKKINPNLKVIVDGGMNPDTIKLAAESGADYFVSGSYTTKAEKPADRIKMLLKSIKSVK